jgi:hypothetical protein
MNCQTSFSLSRASDKLKFVEQNDTENSTSKTDRFILARGLKLTLLERTKDDLKSYKTRRPFHPKLS